MIAVSFILKSVSSSHLTALVNHIDDIGEKYKASCRIISREGAAIVVLVNNTFIFIVINIYLWHCHFFFSGILSPFSYYIIVLTHLPARSQFPIHFDYIKRHIDWLIGRLSNTFAIIIL